MDLEKIRTICFFVGIICGVIGFLIAKIYTFAFLMLVLGIAMIVHEHYNKSAIEIIMQLHKEKDKGWEDERTRKNIKKRTKKKIP